MATYIDEYDAEQRFNDWLDEIYPDLTIAGYPMQTSRVLKEVDPIAWREEYLAWLDSEDLTTDELEADFDDSQAD